MNPPQCILVFYSLDPNLQSTKKHLQLLWFPARQVIIQVWMDQTVSNIATSVLYLEQSIVLHIISLLLCCIDCWREEWKRTSNYCLLGKEKECVFIYFSFLFLLFIRILWSFLYLQLPSDSYLHFYTKKCLETEHILYFASVFVCLFVIYF